MNRGPAIFVLALIGHAMAFPILLVQGTTWPKTYCPAVADAWDRIAAAGRFYHDLKNLISELFRCDAEWWSKLSAFIGISELIIIVALAYYAVALRRARR